MAWLTAHWQQILYGVGILITVLNVLNGMLKLPSQAHTVIDKIIEMLSILARADGKGTFKMPFTLSKRLDAIEQPKASSGVTPTTILLLTGLALGAIFMSSCCTLSSTCKGGVGYCASQEVKAEAPNLLPILAELFEHGTGNLEQELIGLGESVGVDLLHCIIQQYFDLTGDKLEQLKKGNAAASPVSWLNADPKEILVGHQRAGEWLKAHPLGGGK